MLNHVTIIGRLTRDPETRQIPNGTVANFTVAVDRNNAKQETDFLPVVTYDKLAETCSTYLAKGRLVAVEGRIQVRNYEKDGQKVYVTEIIAQNVKFLDSSKTEGTSRPAQTSAPAPSASPQAPRAQKPAYDPFYDDPSQDSYF